MYIYMLVFWGSLVQILPDMKYSILFLDSSTSRNLLSISLYQQVKSMINVILKEIILSSMNNKKKNTFFLTKIWKDKKYKEDKSEIPTS